MKIITPPFLQPGNLIAITCPSGYMPAEKAQDCINTLQSWGYEVLVGKTLGSISQNYFSATDEERCDELQAMLDDKTVNAILFGRGGYGMSRIIDKLSFKKFIKNPKWLIGFSDITILHAHLYRNYKVASLHAPMAAAFNNGENTNEYILSLKDALAGKKANYTFETHIFNNSGTATGKLVGGNLSLLSHLIGTSSDFKTKNCLLFIEDVGEYFYNIDRILQQLKRSGKLDKIAGLIIGGFTDMKDTERPFGKTMYEILHEVMMEYDFPVCFNFPVSHGRENVALKIGVEYNLLVKNKKSVLKEL